MNEIIDTIAADEAVTAGVVLGLAGMAFLTLMTWIIASAASRAKRETEATRREIAAYVAEGSISAEEGERLIQPRPWYADWCSGSKKDKKAEPKRRWRQPAWSKEVFGEVVEESGEPPKAKQA